jgi:short-subunit dehydrogenase
MEYAVITGATKGIGKAIAYELAKRKYNLLLVSRTVGDLELLAAELTRYYGVKVHYLSLDLTQINSPDKIAEWIKENNTPVNVLVNNAGYGLWGGFDELTLDEQINMLQINTVNLVKLTYLLLPVLKEQKQSYILNVASTAAYQAVARLNVYSASKSFVVNFSRALKHEMKNTSVSVTCLSPGATATGFMDRAGMTTKEMQQRAAKFNMTSEEVAKFAIDGMLKKKTEIIPGILNKVSVALTYYVPKWLTEKIAAGLYKK